MILGAHLCPRFLAVYAVFSLAFSTAYARHKVVAMSRGPSFVAVEESTPQETMGNLEASLQEIYSHADRLQNCDRAVKDRILALARVLDHRPANAQTPPVPEIVANDVRRAVPLGPINVLELSSVPTPPSGWQEVRWSWQSLLADFERSKNNPTSRGWGDIEHQFRYLLLMDHQRILLRRNMFLDKDSPPLILRLSEMASACQMNHNCDHLELPADIMTFIERQPYYHAHWDELSRRSGNEWRQQLVLFAQQLNRDAASFAFVSSAFVERDSATTLRLTLHTIDFRDVREQLANYIQQIWRGPGGLALNIRWSDQAVPGMFTVRVADLLDEQPSRVLWGPKQVILNTNEDNRGIAHEFGHVLGFRDVYFYVWNQASCHYAIQQRPEDIMSDVYGHVLPEHWQQLFKHYPLAATAPRR